MQPNRIGGSMWMGGFWASAWTVLLYLLGISLLAYILVEVTTLFGFLASNSAVRLLAETVQAMGVIGGTIAYISWRWNWHIGEIGLAPNVAAPGWAAGGMGIGIIAAALSQVLTRLFGGGTLLSLPNLPVINLFDLVWYLVISFCVELVFRGTIISRYRADLARREMLLAVTLTPFVWKLLQGFFGAGVPDTGIHLAWMAAMSVALSMLYVRVHSVWFTAGIRFGMGAWLLLTGTSFVEVESGGLMVWGTAAAILLALEWFGQSKTTMRRGATRPRVIRSKTVQGPWGPH